VNENAVMYKNFFTMHSNAKDVHIMARENSSLLWQGESKVVYIVETRTLMIHYDELMRLSKKYKDKSFNFKIVYFPTTYLLQTYINTIDMKTIQPICIVKLISHIKKQLILTQDTYNILKAIDVSYICIPDLLYDLQLSKFIKLSFFTGLKVNHKLKINKPVLVHRLIKNWEQIFNSLLKTNLYKYLK
jgi:hypothetical protein